MSIIFIDDEESKESIEMLKFLKSISPQMQEKLKTVIWWESLKTTEEPKGA